MSLEVVDRAADAREGVTERGEGGVATSADEPSDDAGVMAMVNADVSGRVAYLAPTVISGRQPLVSGLCYPVATP
jgi:hypothetical protein